MNRSGASQFIGVQIISREEVDISIEDQSDQFSLAVDDGATRVSSNNVRGADEVERNGEVKFGSFFMPQRGQAPGFFLPMICLVFEGSTEGGPGPGDAGPSFGVAALRFSRTLPSKRRRLQPLTSNSR